MWYVYLLKCTNDAIYTGITTNLKRRLQEHAGWKNRQYTSFHEPEEIVYSEECNNRLEAEKRERQIKRWSRLKKLALIGGDFNRLKELSKSRD